MKKIDWSKPIEVAVRPCDGTAAKPARVVCTLRKGGNEHPVRVIVFESLPSPDHEYAHEAFDDGTLPDFPYLEVRNRALKLYVWSNFCPNYDPGIAFAIAEDLESAKELVKASYVHEPGKSPGFYWGPVEEYPIEPIAVGRRGGA